MFLMFGGGILPLLETIQVRQVGIVYSYDSQNNEICHHFNNNDYYYRLFYNINEFEQLLAWQLAVLTACIDRSTQSAACKTERYRAKKMIVIITNDYYY